MAAVSVPPAETARKGVQLALQRLQESGKAGAVAVAMGLSDSTVSRIKTERLEEVLLLIAHLGLKVVPADFRCVNPEAYAFLTSTHERVMREAPHLIWDVEG
jgi:hypothetical protein